MPKDKYQRPTLQHSNMSAADIASGKPSSWYTLEISGQVRYLCPGVFRFRHITALFLNNNLLVELPPDVAQLVHLTFLDVSNNKLTSIPSEIGELIELRELLLNNNQLRTLPMELGRLFQLINLEFKNNPLSGEFLQMYHQYGLNGHTSIQSLLGYMLYKCPVNGSAPPERKWLPTATSQDRTHPAARFTVMCYNVLCDKYCTRQQYGYCPSWALNWEYRKKGILDHILHLNSDIISLQEVETEQYGVYFLPQLQQMGYEGIFEPKSRARTMTEQERRHVDGCAIFYKKDKFRLVQDKLVEFNQLAMRNAEGSDDMLNRVMTKDNIGLCALLETKPAIFENCPPPPEPVSRQLLLVATAHIHWDPQYSDVKMVQTMMLLDEMQKFVEEATRKYTLPFPGPYTCNSIPFVFCGDLNSLPDSGVIEYLCNGKVAMNHEDFKENTYDLPMKKMCNGDKTHMYHNFHLARAYTDIMPVTNYTYDFKGIIDYIFHSRDRLKVLGHLGPYDEEWFRGNKVIGCPHPHIPSDHFSLLVEFEMPIQPPVHPTSHPPPHSSAHMARGMPPHPGKR